VNRSRNTVLALLVAVALHGAMAVGVTLMLPANTCPPRLLIDDGVICLDVALAAAPAEPVPEPPPAAPAAAPPAPAPEVRPTPPVPAPVASPAVVPPPAAPAVAAPPDPPAPKAEAAVQTVAVPKPVESSAPSEPPIPTAVQLAAVSSGAQAGTGAGEAQGNGPTAATEGTGTPGARGVPTAVSQIQPRYPRTARMRGEQGKVTVRASITPAGRSERVAVLTSSGIDTLDEAAVKAVGDARFLPATRNGEPVSGEITLTFDFQLKD
jgi:periplasmic protein TonB